jgi:autoinducer 2-degrading protein
MHVTVVHVFVKPEHIQDFVAATQANHHASIMEVGNRRFDILQSSVEPAHFVLYEAYASVNDAIAHKRTVHYQIWRDTVADWMAEPRRSDVYTALFPMDNGTT